MKMDDYAKARAALDDFLRKENSTLDKYDLIKKKVWLTIKKTEPQAGELARYLKEMADSFTGSNDWAVLYKTE